mmetsp:Transcript_31747/g.91451  ORF Transcript_31747/g.91451 Transcript_31747/m.91451 type:complete len:238 (+) Transcript_31747:264-977(+)
MEEVLGVHDLVHQISQPIRPQGIQLVHEVFRILLQGHPQPGVHLHATPKHLSTYGDNLGLGDSVGVAQVQPDRPQCCLANPLAVADALSLGLLALASLLETTDVVLHHAVVSDEVKRTGLLSTQEDSVAPGQAHLAHGLAEDAGVHVLVAEERVHLQMAREGLVAQLLAQRLREQRQKEDILGLHLLFLLLVHVLRISLHSLRDGPRDAPISEIAPQQPELSDLVRADAPQLRHGRC